MTKFISTGSAWKEVPSGGYYLSDGTVQKSVDKAWVSDGTSWRLYYTKAVPVVLVANPVAWDQINLFWNETAAAATYVLRRNGVEIYSGALKAWPDTGLRESTSYTYTVTAYLGGSITSTDQKTVSTPVRPPLAAPTGFTCYNIGQHPTEVGLSWNAVSGAQGYYMYWRGPEGGAWNYGTAVTGTSYLWPCGGDYPHEFCCVAYASGRTDSAISNTARVHTGHWEQRNINNFQYTPTPATGSWRSSGGWGQYNGDNVFQGAYGSSGYYDGCMTHDSGAFQNWVRNNYGQQVLDHIWRNHPVWTETAVALYRVPGSGYTTGAMSPRINVSPAIVWQTGGPHTYAGGYIGQAIGDGQSAWFFMSPWWGSHVLCNEDMGGWICYSFMTEWDTHENYMQFYGASHGYQHTQLSARCSWNFVTVAQQNTYWW